MSSGDYNFERTTELDEAIAAFRKISPLLATLYLGLRHNGLERHDAAAVVASYICQPPFYDDES